MSGMNWNRVRQENQARKYGRDYATERALESLRRIQRHRIQLDGNQSVEGISTITNEQANVFHALGVRKPIATQQMSLL